MATHPSSVGRADSRRDGVAPTARRTGATGPPDHFRRAIQDRSRGGTQTEERFARQLLRG